jgi:hypothetical protein
MEGLGDANESARTHDLAYKAHRAVYGNGKPESSLLTRVNQLEHRVASNHSDSLERIERTHTHLIERMDRHHTDLVEKIEQSTSGSRWVVDTLSRAAPSMIAAAGTASIVWIASRVFTS